MECRHAQYTICDLLATEFYNAPLLKFAFTGACT